MYIRHSHGLAVSKEELEGELANYIHQRADATGSSIEQVIKDIVEEVKTTIALIDSVLKGLEKEAWTEFTVGYLYFHVQSDRYCLRELGISV